MVRIKMRSGRRKRSDRANGLERREATARPTTKARRSAVRIGDDVANAAMLIATRVRSLVLGSSRWRSESPGM